MDHTHHTVRLYTAQAASVLAAIERDGACFNRAEYVERKYAESSAIFLTAYRWFAAEAAKRVPPPMNGILPYWVFGETYSVDTSGGGTVLTLEVRQRGFRYSDSLGLLLPEEGNENFCSFTFTIALEE